MSARIREAEWAAWMQAAIAGDAVAYRQFLVAITPHLRSVARYRYCKLGAHEGDVEDIVQETLLAIHIKRGTWDQSRPIGPWIAAIVRNKLIDTLRRRGRDVVGPIEGVIDTLAEEECADGLFPGEIDVLLMNLIGQQREIVQSISINAGRQAHLSRPVAAALLSRAEELLAEHPDIRPVDILPEKLPV